MKLEWKIKKGMEMKKEIRYTSQREIIKEYNITPRELHQLKYGYTTKIKGKEYVYPPKLIDYSDFIYKHATAFYSDEGIEKIKLYLKKKEDKRNGKT